MYTTTKVAISKSAASPNDVVEVEWFIGADVRWIPTADDELRLTTGTGVLVARCPFNSAYTDECDDPYKIDLCRAKGRLVCPPMPGGYVIALYDKAGNRRVFTMPYRIEGPVFQPPSLLSLEYPHTVVRDKTGQRRAIPITPLARVTVSFPPSAFAAYESHTNHVLGIIAPHKGDNDGGQARGSYDSFDTVVGVPQELVPHATFTIIEAPMAGNGNARGGGMDSSDEDSPRCRAGYGSTLVKGSSSARLASFRKAKAPTPQKATPVPDAGSSWLFRGRDSSAGAFGNQFGSSKEDPFAPPTPSARPTSSGRRMSTQPVHAIDDDVTMSLMLPSEPGLYQIRYVTTPPTGVPFTVAVSEPFLVEKPPGLAGEAANAAEWQQCDIIGVIGCDKTIACMNERLRVSFNIKTNSGRRLTPLDAIVFYPFGRSEQIEHHDGMYNAIGEALYEGVLELPAPPNEGYYQIGYYSFIAQHVVAVSETAVSVRLPVARLLLSSDLTEGTKATSRPVYQIDCGDPLSFTFEIEEHIFSKQDQIIVMDDLANKVAAAAMHTLEYGEQRRHVAGGKSEPVRVVSGTAEVTIPMPGKYSVHYYSKVRQCPVAQLQAYIQVRPAFGGVPLPFATIKAVGVLPMNEPINVAVMREGHDVRPEEEGAQDCIVVYDEMERDSVAAPAADHSSCYPGIYFHYIRGITYEQLTIPPMMELLEARLSGFAAANTPYSTEGRRIVLRYMASLPGHFARVCTSEAIVTLRDPSSMIGFVRQQLKYVAVHNYAESSHRFSADGRIAAPIAKPRRLLGGGTGPSSTSAHVSAPDSTLNSNSRRGLPPLAMSGTDRNQSGAAAGLSTAFAGDTMAGTFLNFQTSGTEFKGAIMGPREASTSEPIRVVYHITSGLPRTTDRLVLFSRDGCRTISDALVEYAECKGSDLRLGELLLNPPVAEGTYVVGYYSDRHQSVVLASIPFMVSASPLQFMVEGLKGYSAIANHRRKAAKDREDEEWEDEASRSGLLMLPDIKRTNSASVVLNNTNNSMTIPISGDGPTTINNSFTKGLGGTLNNSSSCFGDNLHAAPKDRRRRLRILSTPGSRAPRTKILMIAVGSIHLDKELKGPLNDIELFRGAAIEFFYGGLKVVADEHMRTLCEGRNSDLDTIPTAHNIRKGIRWLTENAQQGDHLVLYYSGCGTVIDGDNCLVPCNYDTVSRYISYAELHKTLLAAAPAGCNATVIIDACYWGSLRDKAVQSQLAPPESVAASALRRRRNRVGIAPEAPWRSLSLPAGASGVMHPLVTEISLGSLDGLGYFLPERFNPVVSIQTPEGQELQSYQSFTSDVFTRAAATVLNNGIAPAGESKHRLIYEASSGSYYHPEGAWDAFNRYTGRTVGVFTCSLCNVMRQLASKAGEVRWWEVHERVMREVAKSPYPQVPRVIVQAGEALDRPAHAT